MQTLYNVFKYVALGVLIVGLFVPSFMAFNAYADFDYTPEQWLEHLQENVEYYISIGTIFESDGQDLSADVVLSDGMYFIMGETFYTMPFELTFTYDDYDDFYFAVNPIDFYLSSDGSYYASLGVGFVRYEYYNPNTTYITAFAGDNKVDLTQYGQIVVVPYDEPTVSDPTAPSSPPAGGDNGTFIQTVGNMLSSVMAWVGAVLTALFTASGAFNGLIVFVVIGSAVAIILFVRKLLQKLRN